MSAPDLVITGVGAVTGAGHDPEEVFETLLGDRHGFRQVEDTVQPATRCRWASRVEGLEIRKYLPPMRARRLDKGSRFAVAAARQALASAGLDEAPQQTAVILGTGTIGATPSVSFLEPLFEKSPEAAPPFEFPNTVANAAASHVSIELGLQGPNLTLTHKETVAAQALLFGGHLLADGRCPVLLVGACDDWNPYYQLAHEQLRGLRSEPEEGAGILLGEGAAILAVETAASAAQRGAEPLARVLGVDVRGTGAGETYHWVACPETRLASYRAALGLAGIAAQDVGTVISGVNGVPAMDRAEASALEELFGDRRPAVAGVKGAVGESAAASALSLVVAALSRRRGTLPPLAGHRLLPAGAPGADRSSPKPHPPGATLISLCGSGGNYATVVLG